MKKSLSIPMILIALLMMLTISACGFSIGKQVETEAPAQAPNVIIITATPKAQEPVLTEPPAPIPTEPPAPLPTEPPVLPTEPPLTVVTEPPAASDEPLDFFVEEFDQGLDNWSYFIYKSTPAKEEKADVYAEDSELNFKLTGYDIYYYLIYDPFTYGDVRLDVEVENIGLDNNRVSLVCRYDDELGWYEFNVSSGGLWEIWYYDKIVYKGYQLIANGASLNVNTGRDSNVYSAVCQDKYLTLYINGTLVKTVEHKDLDRGLVGLGISSFDGYPVIMKVPWFEISQP